MAINPTPNMALPVPVVGEEVGPQYATDVNNSLIIIDSHDHAAGAGVLIKPNGLLINTALPFNGNDATLLRSTRYSAQVTPLAGVLDLGCLYVSGVDLWFNDESGNQIQITASGGIVGTPGSIGGLVPPASVIFSGGPGTFIFQSAAAVAGNIDGASITIREQALSTNGITLSSPSALASNYSIVFPGALPGAQNFVSLDNSGNLAAIWNVDNVTIEFASNNIQVKDLSVTTAKVNNLAVTAAKIANQVISVTKQVVMTTGVTVGLDGYAVSVGSGSFTTTGPIATDVPNLTVTITTSGRPVCVRMVPTTGNLLSYIRYVTTSPQDRNGTITVVRDATVIASAQLGGGTGSTSLDTRQMPTLQVTDLVAAGTYTYKIQANISAFPDQIYIEECQLEAYEL